jgi:hypothetical protein
MRHASCSQLGRPREWPLSDLRRRQHVDIDSSHDVRSELVSKSIFRALESGRYGAGQSEESASQVFIEMLENNREQYFYAITTEKNISMTLLLQP